ncbi:hypothetical protein CWI37_1051p0020 [Hamiltosporidium tvaerminnensis]|uniref:Uncharacterized protein n=1 Tax=Hamiltosporidium tvaerminnensis TaxID=1176355 RepID=A0A4Q9KZ42_9MICR|nr:hypothetical protein CWI37_1051p0020 [Hamiltosporidium tvaerminnensis]
MCNKNIPERNKDLYLKLLKKDNFKDKIKIFEFLILYLDTILETNTKKIIIEDLEITSSFLKYLLSINGLENLEIKNSEIFIEKDICIKNNSIKYFRFSPKNSDNLHCFYEIINMMQGLKEINFESTESITFRQYDENFDFKTTDNDISASKCPSESLKELEMYKIDLQNIFFSKLFRTSLEYNIKKLRFVRTNIFERDLTFIANLKKLKELFIHESFIYQKIYHFIKILFLNDFYIELKNYATEENISEEIIRL